MNKDLHTAVMIICCGFVGIILASIVYVLHEGGVIVDEFITGSITLPEVMAVVIIIWLIIGVIVGVLGR